MKLEDVSLEAMVCVEEALCKGLGIPVPPLPPRAEDETLEDDDRRMRQVAEVLADAFRYDPMWDILAWLRWEVSEDLQRTLDAAGAPDDTLIDVRLPLGLVRSLRRARVFP